MKHPRPCPGSSARVRAAAIALALLAAACGGSTEPRRQTGPLTPQGPAATPPNVAPIAVAGADQVLECTTHAGAAVLLSSAGSRDTDGVVTKYEWFENGYLISSDTNPKITLPLGEHQIILRVTDDKGGTNDDLVVVTVRDTQAPMVQWTIAPTTLWPPNHKMRRVAHGAFAIDVCDPSPLIAATIGSSEPVNGLGDGDAAPDWRVATNGNGTLDLWVRAERGGGASGRLYTLDGVATDHSGNHSAAVGYVTVPHDQR